MSEFKFACPVCGQHIKCDSSQAGTQMVCPTCFQKIIVPQAPAGEQTLILTGTKVGERPAPAIPDARGSSFHPVKRYSGVGAVLIIFAFIAVAVGFVYRGTIFKNWGNSNAAGPPKPSKPALVAPQANDTNWMLDLAGVTVPRSLAAGRVAGQNFICRHAIFSKGFLSFHDGNLSFGINLAGVTPETLEGKKLDIGTNAPAAARVVLRWKEDNRARHLTFTNGYAMLLAFRHLTGNRIDGQIYLCTSDDQQSYLAGTFKAEIRKPRPGQ